MAPSHASTKLVGRNYTTPDLVAKVTGRARYAEDFLADGMLWTKLLLSPMPHARVTRIDVSAAAAMPGVKAILTADDLPPPAATVNDRGQTTQANVRGERALTNEPLYEGEPILAIAAVDELTATEAIERVQIEFERLPFTVDPLESLRPGGANARENGNVWFTPPLPSSGGELAPADVRTLKWTESDFAAAPGGQLPLGEATDQWAFGDIEAGFRDAALVLDETFVTPNTTHHPLETRSAMAYWQNGKLHMHCSTQSTVQTIDSVARWLNMDAADVVIISEYTGGGFGSKATGSHSVVIPALLSKKANAPVMMRISREQEHYIGRSRSALHGRMKVGFARDGRILALDMFILGDLGPYEGGEDYSFAPFIVSLMYQPVAMRYRGVGVMTNTPPKGAQRQPGGAQGIALMEPVIAKAAYQLGIDPVAIHRVNAPEGKAPFGPANEHGTREHTTSAFVRQALDKGAELFDWDRRKQRSRERRGSAVRGLGVATSTFVAGAIGFDGLFVLKPDGRMLIYSGIGNLGTESFSDVHRAAADAVGIPWEQCDVVWGNTSKHLPWTCVSGGSQTTYSMTRAAHAAGMDAVKKLQAIAAKTWGGDPADYQVADQRVFGSRGSMTLGEAAQKAIALGGLFDGHEVPENVNAVTKKAAEGLAGTGLMGVARDEYPSDGQPFSSVVAFAEVEVDVETGKYQVLDYLAVADVGTVLHPRVLGGQILGGSLQGMGHAMSQKWVYDQHYGVALAKRFYQNRPATILDAPVRMRWAALDVPDPETPVGARGVGEPPVGAGYAAVLNALADAVGHEVFRRSPVTADMILTSLEAGERKTEPLTANI
jgi:xanthine dehydrogenase molybdenum-binding subunit